jgi:quinol monooxygenase YgiN
MIYITVKFPIRPEKADQFLDEAADYTAATRAEEGNIFFEWSRSTDEPNTFVLLEAFRDSDAGAAHVAGQHVKDFFGWAPDWVSDNPKIIYIDKPDLEGWGPMGEIQPRGQ